MADDFETMLKTNDLEKLSQELSAQINPQSRQADERFWYPNADQAGNGSAIIRFLPAPKGESSPLVRIWSYRFKGPSGAWYSEKSLTTLGLKDPVGEYNSELWNTGDEALRNQARDQKRKLTIISNIYVVKDPKNPENEGKVFLYRYGKKIWDMIDRAMNPLDPDDPEVKEKIESGLMDESEIRPAFDPFHPLTGANFRVAFKTVGGFRRYDGETGLSKFLKNEKFLGGDKKAIKEVWEQEYGLEEFVSPDKFKSYDELKAKLNQVLGLDQDNAPPNWGDEDEVVRQQTPAARPEREAPKSPEISVNEDEDDDDLNLDFLNDIDDDEAA